MTAVKIYTCILANIPGKQNRQIKIARRLDSRFWPQGYKTLVQPQTQNEAQ